MTIDRIVDVQPGVIDGVSVSESLIFAEDSSVGSWLELLGCIVVSHNLVESMLYWKTQVVRGVSTWVEGSKHDVGRVRIFRCRAVKICRILSNAPLPLGGGCEGRQYFLGHLIQNLSEHLVIALHFAENLAVVVISNFLLCSASHCVMMLQDSKLVSSKAFSVDNIQNASLVLGLIYDFLPKKLIDSMHIGAASSNVSLIISS